MDNHAPAFGSFSQSSSGGTAPLRPRPIAACLTCRRRKVKCDQKQPICSACIRSKQACTYLASEDGPRRSVPAAKVTKSIPKASRSHHQNQELFSRIEKLEALIKKVIGEDGCPGVDGSEKSLNEVVPPSSAESNGTLILENGQSHFVSSLHWSLVADEISDIKALVSGQGVEDFTQSNAETPPDAHCLDEINILSKDHSGTSLAPFLPASQEEIDALLDIFYTNVNPLTRIIHVPTLKKQLSQLILQEHPLAFAIFYSAINSIKPSVALARFNQPWDYLFRKFKYGLEMSLVRADFLTTSSFEVLQAFMFLLTCQTREDDIVRVYTLIGIALRLAMLQGLHKDPALFPVDKMHDVTVELRRRVWYHICHLEIRAAECRGLEPYISEIDFTTRLPLNIDDEELSEENLSVLDPQTPNKGITDISMQLVRFSGINIICKVIQQTRNLEERILKAVRGADGPEKAANAVKDLAQEVYKDVNDLVDEGIKSIRTDFVPYCDSGQPQHQMILCLVSIIESVAWVKFWFRIPRAHRDTFFSYDAQHRIFLYAIQFIECFNLARKSAYLSPYSWHFQGHRGLQAIMLLISQLRSAPYPAPDRKRAIAALKITRDVHEPPHTRTWRIVQKMIDKVCQACENDPEISTNEAGVNPENISIPFALPEAYSEYRHPPSLPCRQGNNESSAPMPEMRPAIPGELLDLQGLNTDGSFDWDTLGGIDMTMPNSEFDWSYWNIDPSEFHL